MIEHINNLKCATLFSHSSHQAHTDMTERGLVQFSAVLVSHIEYSFQYGLCARYRRIICLPTQRMQKDLAYSDKSVSPREP